MKGLEKIDETNLPKKKILIVCYEMASLTKCLSVRQQTK